MSMSYSILRCRQQNPVMLIEFNLRTIVSEGKCICLPNSGQDLINSLKDKIYNSFEFISLQYNTVLDNIKQEKIKINYQNSSKIDGYIIIKASIEIIAKINK